MIGTTSLPYPFIVVRAARTGAAVLVIAVALALVSGCASVPKRNPLPEDLVAVAHVPGGVKAKHWGDQAPPYADQWFAMSKEEMREMHPDVMGRPHNYLAISGGGANGAFGAGLLCGWTETGTRPEFTIVTGISTGALIAPFAFLGSEYDDELREFYTTVSTKDIIKKRSVLNIISSDAAASSEPLQQLLEEVITQELIDEIGTETKRGRGLHIATTNLDAQRPVSWDIGDIANSGDPRALDLIRQVILASASIPGAFPPVLIEVEANGETYDEMHVDGGASAQVFLYPAGIDWDRVLEKLDVPGRPDVYVIRNSKLVPEYRQVENKIFAISGRSVASMIRTQGLGNLYEIYLMTQRDGLDYHLAYIPDDFTAPKSEQFDPAYMSELFNTGYELARDGYPWKTVPPGYSTGSE